MIGNLSKDKLLSQPEIKNFDKIVKEQQWNFKDSKDFDILLNIYPETDRGYIKK